MMNEQKSAARAHAMAMVGLNAEGVE